MTLDNELQEDQRYLIELAGIGHIVRPEWKNQSKGPITTEVINKYYKQLSVVQLLQLYNIYRYSLLYLHVIYTLSGKYM